MEIGLITLVLNADLKVKWATINFEVFVTQL